MGRGLGWRRVPRWKIGVVLLFFGYLLFRWYNGNEMILETLWNPKVGLQVIGSHLKLERSKIQILGGSIHYFRVPREYWKDRLLKLKACGLNTLTIYVPWNLHEPERGMFDFTGNLDLVTFIRMAEDVGLWVILCPGPYISSELDLGGLPSWLLQDPRMRLRTTYRGFTKAVNLYFNKLIPKMIPLQYRMGGPIIAVQVENEYGAFNKDQLYMTYVKKALLKRGIVEMLMTSDDLDNVDNGSVEGALPTINLKRMHGCFFKSLEEILTYRPLTVIRYMMGKFDVWGDPHEAVDMNALMSNLSYIIMMGFSVNLYMFHGGTNFGFINGATHLDKYKSAVTSYDSSAVLSEAGDYTYKFHRLRKFFNTFTVVPLSYVPALKSKGVYNLVQPLFSLSLWDILDHIIRPITTYNPVNMENLRVNNGSGQSYGYIVYETMINNGGSLFVSGSIRDHAQVFVDMEYVGLLDYELNVLNIPSFKGQRKLSILVENCGRVNSGLILDNQRKGLIGEVFLNRLPLRTFRTYNLEMKPRFFQSLQSIKWKPISPGTSGPNFFRGILHIGSLPLDTFLSLEGWTKGAVFINGRNLGRYWNIGPQKTLFLPGPWLHMGKNEIIVFEEYNKGRAIEFTDKPHLIDINHSIFCQLS